MDNQRLETIIQVFEKYKGVEIVVPFYFNKSAIKGRIRLSIEEEQLTFDVNIPDEYPLVNSSYSIIFSIYDDIKGLPHQGLDDKICILSSRTAILSEKLNLEIGALKKWMLKYYINEEEDEHYEYLQYINHDKEIETQLLYTTVDYNFKKDEFGLFQYGTLTDRPTLTSSEKYQLQIIQSFNGKKCQWAERLHNTKNSNLGLWFYIEEEPTSEPGVIIEDWSQLSALLNYKQKDFLLKQVRKKEFKINNQLFILIGYNISSSNLQEVHWRLIKVNPNELPIIPAKHRNKKRTKPPKQTIHWSKTKDCSYNRFFGRGKLSDFFTNKKILIIGVGAIGSSLAVSLIRGGLKNICLSDFDIVETGNICRAEFMLTQEGLPKVHSVINILDSISPFINIEIFPRLGIPKIRPKQTKFEKLKSELSEYDIIFDCSTDMEIAYMLDKMDLSSLVINLSITNGANELGVVIGNDIAEDKARIFDDLETDENLIYEGEGCAFPTFKASYVDINSLVNYGLMNLDYRFNQDNFNSFVISVKQTFSNIQFEVDEY
jgi:hypothetical protein